MSNEFTCDVCGETYDSGLTDDQARAQLEKEFPCADEDDCGVVCDDCFKRMFPGKAHH